MFWDKYIQLCTKIGKSPNAVAEELGITSGTVSGWKNDGRIPYNSTKLKITQYFGVESDYFEENNPNMDGFAAYEELTHNLTPEKIKMLETYANFLRTLD